MTSSLRVTAAWLQPVDSHSRIVESSIDDTGEGFWVYAWKASAVY